METSKQYNFTLPKEIGKVIDQLPKGEKGKFVAQAIEEKIKSEAQKKVLDTLANLKPKKGNSDKNSVELIQEMREARDKQIINN